MQSTAKSIAFAIGTTIAAVGITGILFPDVLVWIARLFDNPASWLTLAAVRITVGTLLLTAAPRSRFPRGLRALGAVIVVLAMLTLLAGLAGVKQASGAIDAWLAIGMTVVRLTALPIVALGTFIAYACGPRREVSRASAGGDLDSTA